MSNSLDIDQARRFRSDVLSGLILVQTVCKDYQQTTHDLTSRRRDKSFAVKESSNFRFSSYLWVACHLHFLKLQCIVLPQIFEQKHPKYSPGGCHLTAIIHPLLFCMLGNCSCFLLPLADFFFFEKLDPDQDRHSVGPDLCSNRIKGHRQTKKVT